MDARIQELADRSEITQLVYRTYRWLDEGIGEPSSVFAQDATADTPGGQVAGIDAVVALATRNHSPDKRVHHLLTNVLVDVDGDRAVVHSNAMVTFAPGEAAPGALAAEAEFQLGGRSRWDAVRTADGWRLSTIKHWTVWSSGSQEAAAPAAPPAAS
ncbi:nuclear transport factor 2 family protein [Spirillospora sp. NPDC047279]|uniref:nuclear transport factor 2 family protein n=1 Tax=Spirillospora sp. NPDC047279 TaxID=3155478 RepID=UPI0033E99BF7